MEKEYLALTLGEATADDYKVCSSSVYDHSNKIKQKAIWPSQKFDEDVY